MKTILTIMLGATVLSAQAVPIRWESTHGPAGSHRDHVILQQNRILLTGFTMSSRSLDSGATWDAWPSDLVFSQVLAANERYLFGEGRMSHADQLFGIVRSEDWGSTWESCGSLVVNRSIGQAVTSITVDGDHLYVSVLNLGVFRSDDACATWAALAKIPWTQQSSAPTIGYASGSKLIVWNVPDGLFLSVDRGATWESIDARLPGARAFTTACDGAILAATKKGVFRSADNGQTWAPLGLRESMSHIAVISCDEMFANEGAAIYRSTNGGITWTLAITGLPGYPIDDLALDSQRRPYIAGVPGAFRWSADNRWDPVGQFAPVDGLVVTPADDVIALSMAGLSRQDGNSGTWQTLAAGLPTPASQGQAAVFAFATTPHADLIASTMEDGTLRLRNHGAGWEGVGLANRVNAFLPMASGPILAATFEGVFRSVDGGQTWIERSSGLPSFRMTALAEGPDGTVYSGNWDGEVFRSTDLGERWRPMGVVNSRRKIDALLVLPGGDLLAATVSGLFRRNASDGLWSHLRLTGNEGPTIRALLQDGSRTIVATDGAGVFVSVDEGASWTAANEGLTTKRVFALAHDAHGRVYAGTADGVFRTSSRE